MFIGFRAIGGLGRILGGGDEEPAVGLLNMAIRSRNAFGLAAGGGGVLERVVDDWTLVCGGSIEAGGLDVLPADGGSIEAGGLDVLPADGGSIEAGGLDVLLAGGGSIEAGGLDALLAGGGVAILGGEVELGFWMLASLEGGF
jgi:hypothetical protein